MISTGLEWGVADFAALLKRYREQAGVSQRALARDSAINPAIISRMESGDRGPSGPDQVFAIARALALSTEQTDSLLTSVGFWPEAYSTLGPQDPTLLAVARVLGSRELPEGERARFRRVLDLLAEQWSAGGRRRGSS